MRAYQRALVRVQKGFLKITSGNRKLDPSEEYLPLSCMACALTEFMANRSMESASRHLHGIDRLIEKCGIASLESPHMHTLFYEHRSMYAALCFMDRRSCFYSKEQWMGFALNNTHQHATSHFQMLLDVAYLIPHLMGEHDSTILASVDRLYQMLLHLRQFVYQFDERKRSFECTVMAPLTVAKETYSDDLFRNGIHFATVGVATCLL